MTVNLQPHLEGEHVLLRPLRRDDWHDLFAVASDPLIWEQHPEPERCQPEVFKRFFDKALNEVNVGGGAFAVLDKATGRIIGSTRYHGHDPAASEVEIGWTFVARSHWGGRFNPEMKRLMLDHAFTFVDRVIFLVGEHNIRSQTAMRRLGGRLVGHVESVNYGERNARSVKFVIEKPA